MTKEEMIEFGNAIKAMRVARKLTQVHLASEFGMTQSQITNIERATERAIGDAMITKLEKFFTTNIAYKNNVKNSTITIVGQSFSASVKKKLMQSSGSTDCCKNCHVIRI